MKALATTTMRIFRCCILCTISHQHNANRQKVYHFFNLWIVCKQKCCNGGEDLRRLHSSGDAWAGQSHAHRGKPWNWQNWHLKMLNGWNFQPVPFFYASVSLQPGKQRAQVAFVKVCFCGTTATASRRFYSWITFDTFLPEFFIFGSIGFWRGLSRKPIFFRGYIESHSY